VSSTGPATCPQGHANPSGNACCAECGSAIAAKAYDPTADGFLVLIFAVAWAFFVFFVAAMVGAGNANTQDKFTTYAYISGLGAAPWALLFVVTLGPAAARIRTQRH
jgi:quinol-cytochrome oxidoreductase complex cytochrome b subunit